MHGFSCLTTAVVLSYTAGFEVGEEERKRLKTSCIQYLFDTDASGFCVITR